MLGNTEILFCLWTTLFFGSSYVDEVLWMKKKTYPYKNSFKKISVCEFVVRVGDTQKRQFPPTLYF